MVALLSTHLIVNKLITPSSQGRFVTIDGLRGYLAFFVFLHHSCIWYYYLQSGVWALPPSRLFVHFGQMGVALFFMITGFLFLISCWMNVSTVSTGFVYMSLVF
ncbi:acyltransferase family protein [Pseudomonas karstica]|uniref:acyltransferase family protein n=1 Tax=Pseudomonas karstica TaxID=1055468 RepID=UPI002483F3C4|nr:acyltransferase family protein [Pseudomonas karstica]